MYELAFKQKVSLEKINIWGKFHQHFTRSFTRTEPKKYSQAVSLFVLLGRGFLEIF